MNNKWIIEQINKALEEDNDKLRVRLEVLVDMLSNMSTIPERVNFPTPDPFAPIPQPTVTYEGDSVAQSIIDAKKNPPKEVPNVVRGAGSIISNGEQINYTKPAGT